MVRVLLVNARFGRKASGTAQQVYLLWKHLRDRVEFEVWSEHNIGYWNVPKLKSLSFLFRASRMRVPRDVDIIHVHNPKFAGLFRPGKINILTVHGDHNVEMRIQYGPLAGPILWYINRKIRVADVITTTSPYYARLRGWRWIPNMIDLADVEAVEPADDHYLLFVARDDPVKDYPLFRRIARLAYERLGAKSLSLGTVRGDTRYLRHAVVPWEKVIAYMKAGHALVITSKQETGITNTMLEAWASGLPVLARRIPVFEEVARLHPGALALFEDAEEAVEIIERLLRDEEYRRSMVEAGRQAVERYEAGRVAEQYYRLYVEALEGPEE